MSEKGVNLDPEKVKAIVELAALKTIRNAPAARND